MVSYRFHFVLLSSLLVSTSAFAFDEDTPKAPVLTVKPDDATESTDELPPNIPPQINKEENPLEAMPPSSAIVPSASPNEVEPQGWIEWGMTPIKWLAENTVGAALEGQRALRAIHGGVDLYPFFKGITVKTYDYMNEPAEEIVVPPIAAIVIDSFSNELMPIIENLMINTVRLGGQKAAAEMADKFGIAQFLIDQGVNTVNPIKQFMGPVKLISSFLNGINLAAILGDQATQGVLGTLKKRAAFEVAKKLKIEASYIKAREEVKVQEAIWDTERKEKSGFSSFFHIRPEYEKAKAEWEQQQNKYSTRKQIFFDLLTKIVSKTLDKTVHSMVADMEPLVGSSLMPVMKTLILGTESHSRNISKKVKGTVETLSPAKQAFNTVVKYTTSPKALANLLVPAIVQTAWNERLANVNRTLGAAAGNVGGEVITEQFLRTLRLSKTRLFSRDQLRLNVSESIKDSPLPETLRTSIYYLDGFIDLNEVLQKILRRAGQQASKKVLNVIKPTLSQTFSKIGIHDDINALMYGQIQPSRSAQVVASTVSAVVGGVAHLYTAFTAPSIDAPEDYSESEEDEWNTYLTDMGFSSLPAPSPLPLLEEAHVFSPILAISDKKEQTEETMDTQSVLIRSSTELSQEETKLALNQSLDDESPLPSEPLSVSFTSELPSPDLDASIDESNDQELVTSLLGDSSLSPEDQEKTVSSLTEKPLPIDLDLLISTSGVAGTYKALRAIGNNATDEQLIGYILGSEVWDKLSLDDQANIVSRVTGKPIPTDLDKLIRSSHVSETYQYLRASGNKASDEELIGYILGNEGWGKLSSDDKVELITKVIMDQNPKI